MTNRFQIFSISTLLSIGSLFASDLGIEMSDSAEIAAYSTSKKACDKSQPNCKTAATRVDPTLILQPCPDAWRFSADFLYLLPTVDDTYFVITSNPGGAVPSGTRHNNDFGYNPAFRVGAEYAFCDTGRDIQLFYTYLHATENETVSSTGLWASAGSADLSNSFEDYSGSASSKLKLLYQRFDMNVSQHALNANGLHFYLQPGLEYAYFRLQERLKYSILGSSIGKVYKQSRGWGVGPQLGLGLDCNLYSGSFCSNTSMSHAIALSTLFSSSLLMGQGQTKESDVNGTTVLVDVKDQQALRVIPSLHAKVGLSYLIHGSCVGASLTVGYEFSSYIRGLARSMFPSTSALGNTSTNYYNFDVQGLDISLAVSF